MGFHDAALARVGSRCQSSLLMLQESLGYGFKALRRGRGISQRDRLFNARLFAIQEVASLLERMRYEFPLPTLPAGINPGAPKTGSVFASVDTVSILSVSACHGVLLLHVLGFVMVIQVASVCG